MLKFKFLIDWKKKRKKRTDRFDSCCKQIFFNDCLYLRLHETIVDERFLNIITVTPICEITWVWWSPKQKRRNRTVDVIVSYAQSERQLDSGQRLVPNIYNIAGLIVGCNDIRFWYNVLLMKRNIWSLRYNCFFRYLFYCDLTEQVDVLKSKNKTSAFTYIFYCIGLHNMLGIGVSGLAGCRRYQLASSRLDLPNSWCNCSSGSLSFHKYRAASPAAVYL